RIYLPRRRVSATVPVGFACALLGPRRPGDHRAEQRQNRCRAAKDIHLKTVFYIWAGRGARRRSSVANPATRITLAAPISVVERLFVNADGGERAGDVGRPGPWLAWFAVRSQGGSWTGNTLRLVGRNRDASDSRPAANVSPSARGSPGGEGRGEGGRRFFEGR